MVSLNLNLCKTTFYNRQVLNMDTQEFQKLVLQQLQTLTEGQKNLEAGQKRLENRIDNLEDCQKNLEVGQKRLEDRIINLEKGQKKLEKGQQDIKRQLKFIWEDIARLDNRISSK
jgi:exonuclease VII small subunit